jgi:hypothetical protein
VNGLTDNKNVLVRCFFIFTLEPNTLGFLSFATNKNQKTEVNELLGCTSKTKLFADTNKSKFQGTQTYPINQELF